MENKTVEISEDEYKELLNTSFLYGYRKGKEKPKRKSKRYQKGYIGLWKGSVLNTKTFKKNMKTLGKYLGYGWLVLATAGFLLAGSWFFYFIVTM